MIPLTSARRAPAADRAVSSDRLHAPAAERNGEAILRVLRVVLRPGWRVLELGSGTGQHAARFAVRLPELRWQPSEIDPRLCASIGAWSQDVAGGNIEQPLTIDVMQPGWWKEAGPADAVLAINLLHCAPREAIAGLLAGAGRLLTSGEPILLYGPFTFNGVHCSASNRSFDRMLRQQNPDWGLRDLNDVASKGARHRLHLDRVVEMPANNHIIILRRR